MNIEYFKNLSFKDQIENFKYTYNSRIKLEKMRFLRNKYKLNKYPLTNNQLEKERQIIKALPMLPKPPGTPPQSIQRQKRISKTTTTISRPKTTKPTTIISKTQKKRQS